MTRTHADDSADALRRRADALLDEMMLGGVDTAAGDDAVGAGYVNGFTDNGVTDNGFTDNGFADSGFAEGGFTEGSFVDNGPHDRALDPHSETSYSETSYRESTAPTGERRATVSTESSWPQPAATQTRIAGIAPPAAGSPPDSTARDKMAADHTARTPANRSEYLIPAEQRYARPSLANSSTSDAFPIDAPTRSPMSAAPTTSAVRRQSASLASSMTGGTRANARSTLLPREVETDIATAEQEIQALLGEIAATLPVGHEAAERGRHLLTKAQHILESDPSRTAEVDYYLQQVRRIVQRTRQMHNDSSLYHRRLTIYLTAWAALAITALAALYLLQAELLTFLEMLFWTGSDAVFVQFAPMVLGALFAGALGATTGVMANMQRHAAQDHGYFDRKYGLRGLLLPLIGAAFGLVLALLWAAVCYFVGWDGTNLWIGLLPAILALVLGFAQERLYGAR